MPGINGSYRIGPSDFFTSGDLLADANTLNNQINRLDNKNWDKPSQSLFDAFQSYLSDWRRYYSNTFGGLTGGYFAAFNNSNRDELIQLETRFVSLVEQYEAESGESVPDIVNVSSGTKDGIGDHIANQLQPLIPSVNVWYVMIALVVGIVAFVIGRKWFMKQVTS